MGGESIPVGDGAHGTAQFELRVFLLGEFRAERGSEAIPVSAWQGRSTPQALVKLLAVTPGHRLLRDQILDLLWPDAEPAAADASLRKALHFARHALETDLTRGRESRFLHLRHGSVILDPDKVWFDVDAFEQVAAEALAGNDPHLFESALAAYRGELLPEDQYLDWTVDRRQHLQTLHLRLLLGYAGLLETAGEYTAAGAQLQAALALDPTREDIHRRLMLLHRRAGNIAAAIRQYQECARRLQVDVGVEPDQETRALYQDLLTGASSPPEIILKADARPLPRSIRRSPRAPLIGRERAFQLMLESLRGAAEGEGELVLIGGEAGVGKTRLMAEVVREAHRRSALVLWGGSYEPEGPVPYGAFVEALEVYLEVLSADERKGIAERYPGLSRFLPTLALFMGEPAPVLDANGERARMFASISRFLTDLSAHRLMVLALDDLHAADAASLELLHHLARRAHQERWLLLATYREEEAQPRSDLHRMRAALTRAGLCRRVDLRRLVRSDADRLTCTLLSEGEVGGDLLDELYALSLGNPLFLHELVQSMREGQQIEVAEGLWRGSESEPGVPRGIRELVETRVHRLGDDVTRMLGGAAVAGDEFSFPVLQGTGVLDEPSLLDALDRALDAHVIEERGEAYAFAHPLIRATLYSRLSLPRRTQLHGAVGRTIERLQPDKIEALAYHYSHSDEQEKAITYLERAGDRSASVYAHEAAATAYGRAIGRLDRMGKPLEAASVRQKLGAVLTSMAQYQHAFDVLEEAAAVYEQAGDLASLGQTMVQIARTHFHLGTAAQGTARIGPVLRALEEGGSTVTRGRLHAAMAPLYWLLGRYEDQLNTAERAEELAGSVGDGVTLARAKLWYAMAHHMSGRLEHSHALLEEMLPTLEAIGDLEALGTAFDILSVAYACTGDAERAFAFARRQIELAERQGDPVQIVYANAQASQYLFFAGDWSTAQECVERAEALHRETGDCIATPFVHFQRGRLCLADGRREEGIRHLQRCITLLEARQDDQLVVLAQGQMAELDLIENQPQEAIERLTPLKNRSPGEEATLMETLHLLASAHVELGHLAEAEQLLTWGQAWARREHDRAALMLNAIAEGRLETRRGRWDKAVRSFDEAMSIARAHASPYIEGQALYFCGIMETARGDCEAARERLLAALPIFQRLGASPYVERTVQALQGMGISPNGRHSNGAASSD